MKCLPVLLNAILLQTLWAYTSFTILHNNDMHARFDEYDRSIGKKMIGGMARTSYKVKEFRKAAKDKLGPPVLFLNAGDTFSGTIWFSVFRWKIAVEFLNLLMPDAMCLGNHEFDDGVQNLTDFAREANFSIVTCNANFDVDYLRKHIKPSVVYKFGLLKVGVVGSIIITTKTEAHSGNTVFHDEIDAVRKEAIALKKSGVHVIIALGHIGYNLDLSLANEVEEVDVVVGGHTNTFLYNGKEPDMEKAVDGYPKIVVQQSGKQVPVVQAYAYTKYLGVLNLIFDKDGKLLNYSGQPIFLSNAVPKDPVVQQLVDKYKGPIIAAAKEVVGEAKTYLSRYECRFSECNIGNFITDSFIDYMKDVNKTPYWSSCAIALVNGGTMRSSIQQGNVTIADIFKAFPYQEKLIVIDLVGAILVKSLENGARAETSIVSELDGEFLQVSGLKVTIDRSKKPGYRVTKVQVRCLECTTPSYDPIDLKAMYKVITNNFLTSGGSGHNELKDHKKNEIALNLLVTEAVIRYFRKHKVVDAHIEGRIRNINLRMRHSNSAGTARIRIIILFLCFIIVLNLF